MVVVLLIKRREPVPFCSRTFSLVTGEIVAIAVVLSLGLGLGAGWLAAQRLVRRPPLSLFGR